MKNLILFLSLIFFQCSQQSYSGTVNTNSDQDEIMADNFAGNSEDKLAHMLRRESGVIVSQAGGTYKIKIRGLANSFGTDTSPLFVINGTSIGHDFRNAADAIIGTDIKSLRVLKGKDAAIYGSRGSSGVIEIKTKTPSLSKR